jgi:hypothetical protein
MTAASVNFIGADNLVTTTMADERALHLKVFLGEVLEQFEKHTIALDKHVIRTLTQGKSASFPILGRMAEAEYHTPGAEILGQEVPHSEIILNIDKMLISHIWLDDLDEAMKHYEVRSRYSRLMGQKLSQTFDNHVLRELVRAGATANAISGENGGLVITDAELADADVSVKLAAWLDMFFQARENFANKFVTGQPYCALAPADYFFLIKSRDANGNSILDRDTGGVGSISTGELPMIAGIPLIPSPMLPTANYSTQDFHAVDCRNTKAIIWTEDAVGTVKLMDLSIQAAYDIRRQGTLMVGRYAMGHGVLQSECAV